jgi:HAD superfamily hydrolase (TIGR01509 family)
MSIDAVIFDCDGTLVDSEPLGFSAILAEARALGIELMSEEDLFPLKGQSMATCLQAVQRRYGQPLPDDFEATLRKSMAAAFRDRLQPMPGALEMLRSLKLPYCVASNGPREKIELTLEITGLLPLFRGRVFSAYEVGSFKPEPGLFLHAARAMGVVPERCAVVEDSVAGVRAGLAAGMSVYALRSPQPLPPDLAGQVQNLDRLDELVHTAWNRAAVP